MKKKKEESISEVTASSPELLEREYKNKINKLDISFPNEDMNKLVGKINELIDKTNDSI